jgi:hypothetical protein
MRRSVPTQDQVLVPETLLKKRKSQEKARAEKSAEIEKKKAVCQDQSLYSQPLVFMMHNHFVATRLCSMLLLN